MEKSELEKMQNMWGNVWEKAVTEYAVKRRKTEKKIKKESAKKNIKTTQKKSEKSKKSSTKKSEKKAKKSSEDKDINTPTFFDDEPNPPPFFDDDEPNPPPFLDELGLNMTLSKQDYMFESRMMNEAIKREQLRMMEENPEYKQETINEWMRSEKYLAKRKEEEEIAWTEEELKFANKYDDMLIPKNNTELQMAFYRFMRQAQLVASNRALYNSMARAVVDRRKDKDSGRMDTADFRRFNEFSAFVKREIALLQTYRGELENLMGDHYYLIYDTVARENKFITLTKTLIRKIFVEATKEGIASDAEKNRVASDVELYEVFKYEGEIDLERYVLTEVVREKKNSGAYFPYTHASEYLLNPLQILRETSDLEDYERVTREHCFVSSLYNSLVENGEYEKRKEECDNLLISLRIKLGRGQFKTQAISQILPDWLGVRLGNYNDFMMLKGKKTKEYLSLNARKDKSLVKAWANIFLFKEHFMPNINVQNVKTFKKEAATVVVRKLWKAGKFIPSKFYHYEVNEMKDDSVLRSIDISRDQDEYTYMPKKIANRFRFFCDYEALVEGEKNHQPFKIGYVSEKNRYRMRQSMSEKDLKTGAIFTDSLADMIRHMEEEYAIYIQKRKDEYEAAKKKLNEDKKSMDKEEIEKNEKIISEYIDYVKKVKSKYDKIEKTTNKTDKADELSEEDIVKYGKIMVEDKRTAKLMSEGVALYFHNMKYDYSFIKKNPFINIKSELVRTSQLYSVKFSYKGYDFTLIDSYKLTNIALAKFNSEFQLGEMSKMKFDYYNLVDRSNFMKSTMSKRELKNRLHLCEKKSFRKKDFEHYMTGNEYHFQVHYDAYLERDCLTLKAGMDKMDSIIKEITQSPSWPEDDPRRAGLSVYNYLTISSLAFDYLKKEGCLDGVCEIKGALQQFLNKFVVGGRTCTKDNKKMIINAKIQDFDACGLYSSSMSIMKCPMGKLEFMDIDKVAKDKKLNKQYLDNYLHYFIACKVKVNKMQQTPMLSYVDDEGVRQWTNDIPETLTVYLDKTSLEDAIEFHNIDILSVSEAVGYHKDRCGGYNLKVNETVTRMYNERLKAKAAGKKALANTMKLILNSLYGKSLLKDCTHDVKFVSGFPDLEKFLANNFHRVKNVQIYADRWIPKYKVDVDPISYEYGQDLKFITKVVSVEDKTVFRVKVKKNITGNSNFVQFGCIVLSTSKRIMNQVLGTANDENIDVYYNDTDSIHMLDKDTEKLRSSFKERYGRELIGENMLQFHNDFEPPRDENDKFVISPEGIHSRKFIGLGKKCYLDILQNAEGKECYHIRFKGANSENIIAYCDENKITVEDFYTKLYEGEIMELDLCNGKVRFKHHEEGISTLKSYVKSFYFGDGPRPVIEKEVRGEKVEEQYERNQNVSALAEKMFREKYANAPEMAKPLHRMIYKENLELKTCLTDDDIAHIKQKQAEYDEIYEDYGGYEDCE